MRQNEQIGCAYRGMFHPHCASNATPIKEEVMMKRLLIFLLCSVMVLSPLSFTVGAAEIKLSGLSADMEIADQAADKDIADQAADAEIAEVGANADDTASTGYTLLTEAQFQTKLNALRSKYPDGSVWEGVYYEGGTARAWTCWAYAAQMLYEVFGVKFYGDRMMDNIYYDVYGIATNGKQVKFGSVYIKAGSGDYVVNPDVYTQYSTDDPIKVTAKTADFSRFTRFAVISMGSSSGGAYADGYTSLNSTKTELTFDEDFLDGLTPGYYDIYGVTSKGEQVKLGSMYIKASNGGFPDGKWDLWPDYTIPWTSGDDPLMFRSNLMALRQTYPRYTIVPRWGSGAGSIPNNMVDVNQFWDMGDGVFALGTNFLRSLPAGTYTLQVVDYKHLADCTNVVTFRIGSTLRPIDTDKHIIGSIKNLRFLCDEPVYEVYVGNIPLTYGEDYALSNGNKTITLSFEFLNKRSAGNTYTIKALTASGTYPSSTFQILSTAQGSASPRTGDESNLGLWAAFLLLSGAAVVVLVPKLRKHDF